MELTNELPMALSLETLTAGVRKTHDGKVSVLDVIATVKQCSQNYAATVYKRLIGEERIQPCDEILIPQNEGSSWGGCRKPTPVTDARGIVQMIWGLPGKSDFRRQCADVCVRYSGGDPTLIEEIFQNRLAQETLARE